MAVDMKMAGCVSAEKEDGEATAGTESSVTTGRHSFQWHKPMPWRWRTAQGEAADVVSQVRRRLRAPST